MKASRPGFLDGLLRGLTGRDAEVILGDLDQEWPERVAAAGRRGATLWYVRSILASVGAHWTGEGRMGARSKDQSGGTGWTREVRYELRALLRSPLWTGLAVGTVATGIVFAVVVVALAESVRTELVPYPEPERLFYLQESNGRLGAVADPTLRRIQERSDVFEAVGAWGAVRDANLTRPGGEAAVVSQVSLEPGSMAMLGYGTLVGRSLVPEDGLPEGERVALISYGFWQREMGGAPGALDAVLTLNGVDHRVVGILHLETRMPPLAGPAETPDLWTPVVRTAALATDPGLRYRVVVRAASGLDRATVAAAGSRVMEDLRSTLPQWRSDPSWHVAVEPLRDRLEAGAPAALGSLAAATALLLVLVAANLVALTLARLQSRQREYEVLAALGAPPGAASRRLVAQNVLVGLLGTAAAWAMAAWLLGLVRGARPSWLPGAQFAQLDPASLGASLALSLILCAGVALTASRMPGLGGDVSTLRSRGRSRGWKWMARGVVLVETGMVVSLAVGAGLVLRSLTAMASVDTAVELENRVSVQVQLTPQRYPDSRSVRRFTDQVLERLESIPGVEAAATNARPLERAAWNFVILEGRDPAQGELPSSELEEVTPGFFRVVGLDVVRGRGLEPGDYGEGSEPVVVVNEALAKLFQEPTAVGSTLSVTQGPDLRVVGVVEDMPSGRLDQPAGPRLYVPDMDYVFPWTARSRWFVARTSDGGLAGAVSAVRTAVADVDPTIAPHPPESFAEIRGDLLEDARFRTAVFGFLGVMALILGAAGIYGVVSNTLAAAHRETGIRLALGATRWRVFGRTVAAETGAVAAGALLGVVAAWQLGTLLAGFLFAVTPGDLPTYAVVLAGVSMVAGAAIVLPAYRSASADPVEALRAE